MQTILDLISEIRWNPNMASSAPYRIGYMDRFLGIRWIDFTAIDFKESDKFAMALRYGKEISMIPFHRIREVKRGEETIWKRTVESDV